MTVGLSFKKPVRGERDGCTRLLSKAQSSFAVDDGKVLVDVGAKKISAFCTHGVFPNDKHERFTGSDMFENFWITDSCPQTVARVEGKKPFKILSLAGRIAQALEF